MQFLFFQRRYIFSHKIVYFIKVGRKQPGIEQYVSFMIIEVPLLTLIHDSCIPRQGSFLIESITEAFFMLLINGQRDAF